MSTPTKPGHPLYAMRVPKEQMARYRLTDADVRDQAHSLEAHTADRTNEQ